MASSTDVKTLLFVGGGHAHVLAIRELVKHPLLRAHATRVVMISNGSKAYYSGMLPGAVAG